MIRERPALHVVAPLGETTDDLIASGDLDALYRRYAPYVAAVAHRLLGRDHEVEDTVQEVFVAAIRGLAQLRDPASAKAWLARVCVRTAHRKLRKRRVLAMLGLSESCSYETVADSSATPEERALIARVYGALDTLPPRERVAWSLRHIEGERLDDIASLCECSLATAKRRIAAASVRLEELLIDD
jgi:RNA polymerase sigma-70 factor (ECF subfamily)